MEQSELQRAGLLLAEAACILSQVDDVADIPRNVAAEVWDYAAQQRDYFTSRQIDRALRLTQKERNARRVAVNRLVSRGVIGRHPTRRACFKWIDV